MIDVRKYAYGTLLVVDMPFSFYVGGKVMCSDAKVRTLKRIASTADTFFSVPAAIDVWDGERNRTVAGYVTFETVKGSSVDSANDPMVAKFRAYAYGKNHDALPDGAWRVDA